MLRRRSAFSRERDLEFETVALDFVMRQMEIDWEGKTTIIILDACRDNPFGDTFQFYSEGLAQTRAPAGTYIAYAAAPGEVAADGTGSNSFYTGALVRTVAEPGLSIEDAFKRVRAAVLKETKGLQVPWTASSITDEFFFNPVLPKVAESERKGADKAVDREVVFWQSIIDSTRPEDFAAYLEQFPSGNFAPLARNRLAELRPRRNAARAAAGDEAAAPAPPRAGTDPALLDVIDRAMAGAKAEGSDYLAQIQAAVEALNNIRRQREEVSRKAEAAREQVRTAMAQKAERNYRDMLSKAEQEAAAG